MLQRQPTRIELRPEDKEEVGTRRGDRLCVGADRLCVGAAPVAAASLVLLSRGSRATEPTQPQPSSLPHTVRASQACSSSSSGGSGSRSIGSRVWAGSCPSGRQAVGRAAHRLAQVVAATGGAASGRGMEVRFTHRGAVLVALFAVDAPALLALQTPPPHTSAPCLTTPTLPLLLPHPRPTHPTKVEVKLRLGSKDDYERLAAVLAASAGPVYQQENFFFDGSKSELNSRRVVVRVRLYNKDQKATLTVKVRGMGVGRGLVWAGLGLVVFGVVWGGGGGEQAAKDSVGL